MNITQSIIVMLFAHLITDYTLQGWLADGKQKSWWNKISNGNLPNKYRHDPSRRSGRQALQAAQKEERDTTMDIRYADGSAETEEWITYEDLLEEFCEGERR